jgi:hypothetical protein
MGELSDHHLQDIRAYATRNATFGWKPWTVGGDIADDVARWGGGDDVGIL